MSSSGTQGALAQVQSMTNQDLWLTASPEATFFQQEFARHTPFAISETDICPAGAERWGSCLRYEIPRGYDFLASTFLKLRVKGLRYSAAYIAGENPNNDHKVSWVNAPGHAGLVQTTCDIGSIQIDRISGEFLEILEQHRATYGNEQAEAIGSFEDPSDLRDFSFNDQVLHVALHYFFFDHPETYLPLIALSSHPVVIKCWLRNKTEIINAEHSDGATPVDITANGVLDSTYNGDIVEANLVTRGVHLDQFERNLVSAETHEIVMLEHHEDCEDVVLAGTSQKSVSISFNNACLAFFTRFRSDESTAKTNLSNKDYFNYCVDHGTQDQPTTNTQNYSYQTGTLTTIPFRTWQIKFNSGDRVAKREAEYFTHVVPFLHAVKKSKSRCIMMYSFHLKPLSHYHTPAGHAQLSRIHEVKSCFEFRSDSQGNNLITEDGTVSHKALGYNLLRITSGQAIKKFA